MSGHRFSRRRWLVTAAAVLSTALLLPLGAQSAQANPTGGAQLWLRADVGVTVNNGKVSHWADQSGYGRHGAMSVSTRQPQLVNGALNGLPVIRFGGAQSLGLVTPANPHTFTIFVVGRNTKPTESYSMILGPGGNWPNNQFRWESGTRALAVGTGNGMPAVTSTVGNTRVFHSLSARYDGSTMHVYRDGNLTSSHAFTTTGPWILAQIGAWYSSYYGMGDIAEIIIYQSALSETDRATTNSYLRSKYALP